MHCTVSTPCSDRDASKTQNLQRESACFELCIYKCPSNVVTKIYFKYNYTHDILSMWIYLLTNKRLAVKLSRVRKLLPLLSFCGNTGACCSFKGCEWSSTLTVLIIPQQDSRQSPNVWQNVFSISKFPAVRFVNVRLFHRLLRVLTSVVTAFECSLIHSARVGPTHCWLIPNGSGLWWAVKHSVFCCVSLCAVNLRAH